MKDIYVFAYASKSKLAARRSRVTIVRDDEPGHDTVHAFQRYETDGWLIRGHGTLPRSAFPSDG